MRNKPPSAFAGASPAAKGAPTDGPAKPLPTTGHDQFARGLGFESYLALFEASTPIATGAPGSWLMTTLQGNLWVVWNAADLQVVGTYASEAEARAAVR